MRTCIRGHSCSFSHLALIRYCCGGKAQDHGSPAVASGGTKKVISQVLSGTSSSAGHLT
jgi:hypothetical protein